MYIEFTMRIFNWNKLFNKKLEKNFFSEIKYIRYM